ncbi:hypothetical protein AES38_01470 [Clavibacter capsici]|nr:hypothetical protein AES38_01470 [Clavibacter capsici]
MRMGFMDRLLGRKGGSVSDLAEAESYEARHTRADAAGSFRGKHFTEWASRVDQLRAEGRPDESLALAYECIEATERQHAIDGTGVAPGYYRDAAVVLRAQKRFVEEVQVLERYLQHATGRHPEIEDRVRKATALRDAGRDAVPLACPACAEVLEAPPKSRGKCPSCGQQLVMRSVHGQRKALTPDQAAAWTAADKAEKSRASFLKRLGYFGVARSQWDRVRAEQSARFGHSAADGDVYWQLANEAAVRHESAAEWGEAGRVRSDMTKFLVEEGRDWVSAGRLAEANWMRALQQYDSLSAEMILIACPCANCQKDDLAVASLRDFLSAWPLPHTNCSRPPCRCRITRKTH